MLIRNVPKTAIRIKGSDSAKIISNGDLKESVTLGLTVSASGSKLKPIIICKGKTEKCQKKFNLDKNTIIGTQSKSGWMNEDIMLLVLDQISEYSKDTKSVLLLDQYDAHKTDKVKNYAESKNISLVYVPIGMTDKYQPLDVGVNGIYKNKMRQYYTNYITNNTVFDNDNKIIEGNNKIIYKYTDFINDVINGWNSITTTTIEHSFNCLE